MICAVEAMPLLHDTSSVSSPVGGVTDWPVVLTITMLLRLWLTPLSLQKVVRSLSFGTVSMTMAMVWPAPVRPLELMP